METATYGQQVGPAVVPESATRLERAALRTLQLSGVLIVLAVVGDHAFELDRFFVPKEAILHAAAVVAGLLSLGAIRRVKLGAVDLLLGAYLVASVISTVFAEDLSLGLRSLAISVSALALFWVARAMQEAGLARPLLRGIGFAAVVGAATALLQVYGVEGDFFSINRAPGGTFGNRNFVAHLAAITLPVLLLGSLRAWRGAGYLLGALGVVVVVAALVLTRSRAGWLSFAAVILVFALGFLLARPLRRYGRAWRRLAGIAVLLAIGVAGAILLPNSLEWRSDNPYLESVAGIANYQEGSGRGRLIQYGRSMEIALDHPLLGVGPGNWAIVYPDYADAGDPSMSRSQPSATANPWPSSDWVAFISERGVPAAILLALAFAGIAIRTVRRLIRARDHDEGLVAVALLATIMATLVAGLFDAVLLLAHPTLFLWLAAGAMWSPATPARDTPSAPDQGWQGISDREPEKEGRGPQLLLLVLALAAAFGLILSLVRLAAMDL